MYYRGWDHDSKTQKQIHKAVTCYAESKDGIHWKRPNLGLVELNASNMFTNRPGGATALGTKENNILQHDGYIAQNFTPFIDTKPDCPAAAEPTPTAAGPQWQGWVVSNTSGDGPDTGIWSVIVVRVLNWGGVPVEINSGGGWSATCITGTKPEYGADACEFGGLWPGTYYLQPEGADVQVEVEMDGLGIAFVEFAAP